MVVTLTGDASVELKKVLKAKNSDKSLRIYIAGYGWGGPTFGIALDEQKEGDSMTVVDDLTFLMESELEEMFNAFTVDYSDNWLRKGFSVIPDGFTSTC